MTEPTPEQRRFHEAARLVPKLLANAPRPVTLRQIAAGLPVPYRLSATGLASLLGELTRDCVLYPWPAQSGGSAPRYWHRSLADCGRQAFEQALAAGPLTRSQLDGAMRRGLFRVPRRQVTALRTELVSRGLADGRVWEHPPRGRGPARVGCVRPDPRDYLAAARRELEAVCRRLAVAGVSPQEVLSALAQMVEPAPGRLPQQTAAPAAAEVETLLAQMLLVEPAAAGGAVVSLPELRRRLQMPKQRFDQVVLALGSRRRLFLHRHVHPGALSPAQLDELVSDGRGTYYIGAVLRSGEGDG
jgi:hypothetical protein